MRAGEIVRREDGDRLALVIHVADGSEGYLLARVRGRGAHGRV